MTAPEPPRVRDRTEATAPSRVRGLAVPPFEVLGQRLPTGRQALSPRVPRAVSHPATHRGWLSSAPGRLPAHRRRGPTGPPPGRPRNHRVCPGNGGSRTQCTHVWTIRWMRRTCRTASSPSPSPAPPHRSGERSGPSCALTVRPPRKRRQNPENMQHPSALAHKPSVSLKTTKTHTASHGTRERTAARPKERTGRVREEHGRVETPSGPTRAARHRRGGGSPSDVSAARSAVVRSDSQEKVGAQWRGWGEKGDIPRGNNYRPRDVG